MFGASGLSAMTLYRSFQHNQDKQLAAYRKQPTVVRAIENFVNKIKQIDSPETLLKDYRLKTFVLQAFGLEELEKSGHLLKRILTDDLDDTENATAHKMKDARFREMAMTLRLDKGMATAQSDQVIQQLVARFQLNGFEKQLGEQNPAVREAVYFKRKIASATSIYQVMADPVLRKVATKGANLPDNITRLDFDKQVSLFTAKVDVSRFKDTKYVDRMVDNFLVKSDMQNGGGMSPMASLFSSGGYTGGFSIIV